MNLRLRETFIQLEFQVIFINITNLIVSKKKIQLVFLKIILRYFKVHYY